MNLKHYTIPYPFILHFLPYIYKFNIGFIAFGIAIAELEHYYGPRLFDRISNRLRITEAGRRFLEYSRQIVLLFDEMEHEIKNWDSLGSLRIGCNVKIGNGLCTGGRSGLQPFN